MNVIGGFALILQKVRTNPDEYTDIDFVGKSLAPNIVAIANKVGMKYNLGRGWLNNDVF